jgi:hypothetical protein
MTTPPAEKRSSIIEAVKTPLGFLVLVLLVVEVTLGGLSVALSEFRAPLVWTVISSVPAFIAVVVGLAVWRPEALRGDRPFHEVHANQFASDLVLALGGALSNLESTERLEAWRTVADVVSSGGKVDSSYSRFCEGVSVRITELTSIQNRKISEIGPIIR